MLLVMIDREYWGIKILVSTKTRNKMKDGFKIYGILKSVWDVTSLNTKISMLVKKEFVDAPVKIIPDNKYKIKVKNLLCNGTYSFTYDVKTTKPSKFSDSRIFHVDNF